MLVCVCKVISDKDIDKMLQNGSSRFSEISKHLGVGRCCGQCAAYAKDYISTNLKTQASIACDYIPAAV